ncbi:MAG: exodeoxyribonuclease VII small subunit [Candidatus Thermoplasmatota archaeon]|nr:exodeoxyribonuclease VII small subunit [Euryarchaeota archaeon]MBU4031189.1 exodeoxyribonuclease VII small subunit [Candidatus Thermoplasmatota archaeon]MBU4143557.1 exodeoxyribonuclease VII small subunit [Candidatus Thermoplasmatota archaeon]MBU4591263.1 exodeoxyribonuclease VII small subunit [Candidatus Thermoplasmatota archaeon]
MAKLEEVNEELQDESIDLERAMKLYEEGLRLSKLADEILSKAETRIKQIGKED